MKRADTAANKILTCIDMDSKPHLHYHLNIFPMTDRSLSMPEAPATWRRVRSTHIADCRVFRVREDECVRDDDGVEADFFVIENPDWVNVIALTEHREVLLI